MTSTAIDAETLTEMMSQAQLAIKAIRQTMNPDGFNMGMNLGRVAGAGIDEHLHMHIVPRWDGDTNFMPVLGQTKVIVESLMEFYDRFTEEIRNDFAAGSRR